MILALLACLAAVAWVCFGLLHTLWDALCDLCYDLVHGE